MQTVYVDGKPVEEFSTRAQAIVYCFEANLVHDNYARSKRNTLLPNVKIEGTDEHAPTIPTSRHPLDRVESTRSRVNTLHNRQENNPRPRSKNTISPMRGPLDNRSSDSSPRRVKVDGVWRRL